MITARALQDAGRERPLNAGQVYDLPAAIALVLIAAGVGVADRPAAADEVKPDGPLETNRRRTR